VQQRIISTLVLWTILILTPLLAGAPGAVVLLWLFGFATLRELLQLLEKAGLRPLHAETYIGGALILFGAYLGGRTWLDLAFSLGLGFVVLSVLAIFRAPQGRLLPALAASLLALIAVPGSFSFAAILLAREDVMLVVWIIVVAKFTDVGALICGLRWGRHKMCPRLSPKKTWEGLAGGLLVGALSSALFALLFAAWLPPAMTARTALGMAVPVMAAAVLADLFESAIKREAGVKDSGNTIPGIGGIFDLTDSLVFALPVGFAVLQWVL
jgi:phosphatidate cytidylyltransferase